MIFGASWFLIASNKPLCGASWIRRHTEGFSHKWTNCIKDLFSKAIAMKAQSLFKEKLEIAPDAFLI